MTSRLKSALIRLSILSLLIAFFSALFLAPINARSDARSDAHRTHRALYDDFNRPALGTTNSQQFLPAYQGLPQPTEIKLTASDGTSSQRFGQAVSIGGDVALIGAAPDYIFGSAYIYRWNGSSWQEEAKLTASDGALDDYFGYSVSIHGELAIIGADKDDDNGFVSGSAYIFRFDGTTWQEEAKLLANDGASYDDFGRAVSIGDDVAIVGAPYDDDNGSSSGSAYIFRFDGTAWQQESKLTASDGASSDYFGRAVSLDGETAIIGAYQDDGHGSAYIYRFDGSDWQEEAKLLANDGASYDDFGRAVSIGDDVAIVGAPYDDDNGSSSGSAYIYRFDGSDWQEEAKLTASDGAQSDYFGTSVSLEGDVALIGASRDDDNGPSSGSAYIYRFDGTNWQESAKVTAGDGAQYDYFGTSVSLSGEMALVGAPLHDDNLLGLNVGAAYLYNLSPGNVPDITLSPSSIINLGIERTNSSMKTLRITNKGTEALTWNINTPNAPWLTVSPLSGTLAADEEGLITIEFDPLALPIGHYTETLTISSNDPDEAELTVPLLFKVMRRTTQLKLTASDGEPYDAFGWAVSLDGEQALIGTSEDNELGSAYLYRFDGSRWVEEAKLTASDGSAGDYFGGAVALSGDVALVGAPGANNYEGSVYIFRWNGSSWLEEGKLLRTDGNEFDEFGVSVSLDGDLALIGSHGAVFVFRWDGSEWQQEAILEASSGSNSEYGYSVSLSGDVAFVGGDNDDSSNPGSVYIFRFNGSTWQEEQKLEASDGNTSFGGSVSVSDDVALVGLGYNLHQPCPTYVYRFNGSSWVEEAELIPYNSSPYDYFGHSLSVSGNLALVAATDGTFLFRFNGSDWQEEAILNSDELSYSVSLSDNLALVGILYDDNYKGAAYLYNLSPGEVPDIDLEPSSFSAHLIAGESLTESLTMTNTGFYTLTWQLAEEADWLEVMPISGTVAVNQEQTITILFDATLLTDGTYTETLTITSNDPDEGVIELPITLLVTAPTPTHTPTSTPTSTATSTPTASATATSTPTASATATSTPTTSATATSTPTASATATSTPTASATATSTPTASATATSTPTASATATSTPTAISTVISTVIRTLTPGTHTPTATQTASSTPTASATVTSTATATGIPTSTPTVTTSPSVTPLTSTMIDQSGGTLTSPDGSVELDFPAGAVKQEISVIYTELLTPSANTGSLRFADLSFDISAFDSSGVPVSQFLQPLSMSISYQDSDWQAAGIEDESYLNLYWWDGQKWLGLLPCNGCQHDTQNNRLTIRLDHLSQFALLADEEAPSRRIYLPVISR